MAKDNIPKEGGTTFKSVRSIKDRGLTISKQDTARWKHDRDRMVGFDYAGEFNQYKPFFFSAERNPDYSSVGRYKGATAFLIGGGPSFRDVDKGPLKNCFTMCMNNCISQFRGDSFICVDDPCRFMLSAWLDPKIQKFVPFTNAEKQLWDSRWINGRQIWEPSGHQVRTCPNVTYFTRNSKFVGNRFFTEATINWGCSEQWGGCRSVMISAIRILFLLGFRKIYLVGVDCRMTEEDKYCFSDGRPKKQGVRGNNNTYDRMNKEYMPAIKKEGSRYGLKIYNTNINSGLKTFEYVPLQNAIIDATMDFGDVHKEKTEGMYHPFNEKFQKYQEEYLRKQKDELHRNTKSN